MKTTLWNIHPFKTLGDNGLHAAFYQKNWDSTKLKLLSDFQMVFSSWVVPSSWCKTLITLIPKIDNPHCVNYFRPIGLYTTHYKILAKLLVNRIRPHIQNLISLLQGVFIKGRDDADLFLLAQEVFHSMNKSSSKKGWMILKLDIRKAIDSIS